MLDRFKSRKSNTKDSYVADYVPWSVYDIMTNVNILSQIVRRSRCYWTEKNITHIVKVTC